MTIKDLKEKIALLDDNMKVGSSGHFGEFLECYSADVRSVFKSVTDNEKEIIFDITKESAGEDPD